MWMLVKVCEGGGKERHKEQVRLQDGLSLKDSSMKNAVYTRKKNKNKRKYFKLHSASQVLLFVQHRGFTCTHLCLRLNVWAEYIPINIIIRQALFQENKDGCELVCVLMKTKLSC